MKITFYFKISALAVGLACTMGANAADGTLTINGTAIAQGCQIQGQSYTVAVLDFGTVSPAAFPSVGSISAKKEINFSLIGCPTSATSVKVMAFGPYDTTNNKLVPFDSSSSAKGLGIALYNKGGSQIAMHSFSSSFPIDASTHAANISLEAALMSTAPVVTGGDFTASALIGMTYN